MWAKIFDLKAHSMINGNSIIFQNDIPPQIEFIDSSSLLLLASLAFVTLTLIETSIIVWLRRLREFRKYKRPIAKVEENAGYLPPAEGDGISNENEPGNLHFSELDIEYRQKCTRIDVFCFSSFILIYAIFIFVYLWLLL